MAIPSVDTYLQQQLATNLTGLLSNSYIIKEVLRDFSEGVVSSFVRTYCSDGDNQGTDIPVLFTFPPAKQPGAFVLVQYKGGSELDEQEGNSLGGVMGLVDQSSGNVISETASLRVDQSSAFPVAYFELQHPAVDILGIQNYSGDYRLEDNRVYVSYMPGMENGELATKVTYAPQTVTREGEALASKIGISRGFDVMENYTIDCIAMNNDTLRCLDAILKAIFIYMKQDVNEQIELRLSKLVFSGVDMINEITNAQNSAFGEQLYYRRTEISYELTYSMNTYTGAFLDKLHISNQPKEANNANE